jgi:hypothetical protein
MDNILNYEVLKEWTNLKLRASQLKRENEVLAKQNDDLKFKVNLLLILISLGLIGWLATES